MTYERVLELHSDVLKNADGEISSERFDIYLKEMIIRNEIMKHDFTKRQLNIMTFIANHSFAFMKDFAVVPKLKDFELCGVSVKHIKDELKK